MTTSLSPRRLYLALFALLLLSFFRSARSQAVVAAVDTTTTPGVVGAVGVATTSTTPAVGVAGALTTTTPGVVAGALTTSATTTPGVVGVAGALTTSTALTTTPGVVGAVLPTTSTTTPGVVGAALTTSTTPGVVGAVVPTTSTTTPGVVGAAAVTTTTPVVAGAAGVAVTTTAAVNTAVIAANAAAAASSSSAAAAAAAASAAAALGSVQFEGTWSSKSNAVFTGPDFYDPVDELLIEPALPGISYSFTADGFWEQAIYRVSANPRDHKCPSAVMIYQHGTWEMLDNQTLILTPFEVDGRQLLSAPCDSSTSTYSRYNQTITFLKWAVYVDPYHGRYRLDIYQFDGSPLPPLYLAYKPPMMLPTITMNPTADASETGTGTEATASATATNASVRRRIRRSLENRNRTPAVKKLSTDYNMIWWTGIVLMGVGATGLAIF